MILSRSRLESISALWLTGDDTVERWNAVRRGEGVVLRSYGLPPESRRALGRRLAGLCRGGGILLVAVRNRTDFTMAVELRAHGVHLPEGVVRHHLLAPILGWRRHQCAILTVAAHGPLALARGRRIRADAALLSPVFPTASHPDAKPLGPVRFAAWSRMAQMPVVALGGIRANTLSRLRRSGAVGFATGDALWFTNATMRQAMFRGNVKKRNGNETLF